MPHRRARTHHTSGKRRADRGRRPARTRPGAGPRRSALRRELPTVLGLLVDEADFTAMRRYDTFPFADHRAYLRQLGTLLRTLAGQGVPTHVVRFRPEDFVRHCRDHELPADSAHSRAHYTVRTAASAGACVTYTGQPAEQLPRMLSRPGAEQAPPAGGGPAPAEPRPAPAGPVPPRTSPAEAGPADVLRRPSARPGTHWASRAVAALLDAAGPGRHHLVCSVSAPGEPRPRTAVLTAERGSPGPLRAEPAELATLTAVLADGLHGRHPGGVVLRTRLGTSEAVRGWQLSAGWLRPLTEAQVFAAYCTDTATGEPLPPEPGVDYRAGFPLPEPT